MVVLEGDPRGHQLHGSHGPHDFVGLFFGAIFRTAFCLPTNGNCLTLGLKIEAWGFHFVVLWDVFLQLLVIRPFFENRAPVQARAQKTRFRGHQNCTQLG